MKILIADDHALFRAGLRGILRDLIEEPTCLEAGTCGEVLTVLAADPGVELLLLDLGMPGMDEAGGVAAVADAAPNLLIVVVSASESRADVLQAINSGAVGYIPKSSSPAVMVGALQLVLAGGIYLPPMLIDRGSREAAAPAGEAGLTQRQREVLDLLVQGRSNKEIARRLNLSISAVKLHVSGVFEALGVGNRTEATLVATRRGLITPVS